MKRHVVCGVVGTAAVTILVGWSWGDIKGSKHDFSHEKWAQDDLCAACHTPHPTTPASAAPLWNPSVDLTRRFGSSDPLRNHPGLGTTMCLRCHDGTLADDILAMLGGKDRDYKQHPGRFATGHRSSNHPVGIDYPKLDRGFRPMSTVMAEGNVPLPNGRVECSSCHDPHNMSGHPSMLVTSDSRSALCLSCHKK